MGRTVAHDLVFEQADSSAFLSVLASYAEIQTSRNDVQ